MAVVSHFQFDRFKCLRSALIFNAIIVVLAVAAEWGVHGKSNGFSLVWIPILLVLFVLTYSVIIYLELTNPLSPRSYSKLIGLVAMLFVGLAIPYVQMAILLIIACVVIALRKEQHFKMALLHVCFVIGISAVAFVVDILLSINMMNLLLG